MIEHPAPGDRDNEAFSYVDADGEWKTRKITLMGVVRSFVSQLKPGQDLTRVSLPAVLLHPYSMLEIFGFRELCAFEVLMPLNKEGDPLERFFCVLRWFFATIQNETFHKKPYNPILGEQHECWTETKEYGRTEFVTEQVSHHPPIAAIYVHNAQEEITNQCNVSFGVKFGGNYVSIVTDGSAVITCDKFKEQYEIAKRTPDMVVKNVIFGTKRIYWSGDVTLSCPKTGYSAAFSFKESGNDNVVNGNITYLNDDHEEETLFNLKGKCGGEIWLHSTRSNEKKLLIDIGALLKKKPSIHYRAPKELDPLESLAVWSDVNKYIIENDMDQADEAKKKIEADQRQRINDRKVNGMEHTAKYFLQTESGWVYKNQKKDGEKARKKPLKHSSDSESSNSEEGEIEIPSKYSQLVQEPPSKKEEEAEEGEDSPLEEKKRRERESASDSSTGNSRMRRRGAYRSGSLTLKKEDIAAAFKRSSVPPSGESIARIPTRSSALKALSNGVHEYPTGEVNIIKGWMKMRNSMKLWINRWFVLRPGKLIYYKDEKDMARDRCAGILRLADCKVKERPTNKDGFSFKIYHLLHYPIYHKYGLKGETLKMAMIPVSWNYCILRVSSEQDRRSWMANIEHQIEYANANESNKQTTIGPMHRVDSFDLSPSDDDLAEKKESLEETEAAEEMFSTEKANEELQRNLMNGLGVQQKNTIKSLQKKTLKSVEEWKKELDLRMIALEKKLMTAINKNNTTHNQTKGVTLTYWQVALICVVWLLLAKIF